MTAIKPRRKVIILLFLCILFLFSRAIFLDSDLPPWDVFNYQPIDELYYSLTAFEIYHHGDVAHRVVPYIESDSSTENIFGNILTSLTLFLFGNTYYGMRMSAVLAAFFVFIAMYFTLYNHLRNDMSPFCLQSQTSFLEHLFDVNLRDFVLIFSLVYMLCDFSFLLSGRVMETTIYRTVPLVGFLWFFSSNKAKNRISSPIPSMIIGFLATAAVFFVYPTNFFLVPALFTLCFLIALKENFETAAISALMFLFGCMTAFLTYEVVLRIFFEKSYFDIVKEVYSIFTGRLAIPVDGNAAFDAARILKRFVYNFLGMLSTNFLRFNIIFLAFFLISLPIFLLHTFREKQTKDLSLFLIALFFILQTLVVNDYFYRKLIIAFPILLLIIARSAVLFGAFWRTCREKRLLCFGYISYTVFSFFLAFFILLINGSERFARYNALREDLTILIALLCMQLVFFVLALTTRRETLRKPIIGALLLLLLAPNVYFAGKYIYLNPTYTYKDTMIKMGEYINDQVVVGGWAHGFRLYNTSTPILNPYRYQYSEKGIAKYFSLKKQASKELGANFTITYYPLSTKLERLLEGKGSFLKTFELNNIVHGHRSESIAIFELDIK